MSRRACAQGVHAATHRPEVLRTTHSALRDMSAAVATRHGASPVLNARSRARVLARVCSRARPHALAVPPQLRHFDEELAAAYGALLPGRA